MKMLGLVKKKRYLWNWKLLGLWNWILLSLFWCALSFYCVANIFIIEDQKYPFAGQEIDSKTVGLLGRGHSDWGHLQIYFLYLVC